MQRFLLLPAVARHDSLACVELLRIFGHWLVHTMDGAEFSVSSGMTGSREVPRPSSSPFEAERRWCVQSKVKRLHASTEELEWLAALTCLPNG